MFYNECNENDICCLLFDILSNIANTRTVRINYIHIIQITLQMAFDFAS